MAVASAGWRTARRAARSAFVGSENSEASHRRRRGDGDIGKAGIARPRAIEDGVGVPRFLNTEDHDVSCIEVFNGGKPALQLIAFRGGPDPGSTGDASLDFCDGDGRNEKPFAAPTYLCRERAGADRTFGRRIGRDDVGVEQIQAEPPHG